MSSDERWQQLRQKTGEAAARQAAVRRELAQRGTEPPRPGDVYVLRETADFPVEWAVLEGGGDAGRLRLVPADANPQAGTSDLSVAAADGGPLTLRCAFATWRPAADLASAQRVRQLPPSVVAAARRLCEAVAAGEAEGSLLAQEVDDDPEYEEWLGEVVAPATATLAALPEARPWPPPGYRPQRRTWLTAGGWLAAAAAAALAVGLLLRIGALEGEVESLSQPVVDPAQAVIDFQPVRGPEIVELGAGEHWLVLSLSFENLEDYDQYELEVVDTLERALLRKPVPVVAGLLRTLVLLPAGDFPDGLYEVRLFGETAGERTQLEKMAIAVRRSASSP